MKQSYKNIGYAIAWLLIWELISHFIVADSNVFPPLSNIFNRMLYHVNHESRLAVDIFASFRRYIYAVLLSFPLSIFVAYFVSQTGVFGGFINFFFSSTYSLPKVAIFPFILLAFGIGDVSKVFLISMGMFYLFYFNVYQGITHLEGSAYFDVIKSFSVENRQKMWNFYFKGSLPFILAGLKTGLGYGLVLVVVSEMSFSTDGIGLFIWNAWDQFRLIDMFIGIIILSIWGSILFFACDQLEKVLNRKGLLCR